LTRQAVQFAFNVFNERYSQRTAHGDGVAQIRPHNTLVIASGHLNDGTPLPPITMRGSTLHVPE
jgi:3HB-oligomer hydrolase (3HBOH)